MYSPPSSPLPIGGVLDNGIRLFRESFSRCWLLAILPVLLLLGFEMSIGLPAASGGNSLAALAAMGNSPRLLLFDLVAFLVRFLFQGAILVRQIGVVHADESVTFGAALTRSARRLPGSVFGSIILLVCVSACFIPFGVTAGYFVARHTVSPVGVVIDLAFLTVAIWLWGRWQLWLAALFIENASAIGALGSSWRLTRGHWWRAATIFTVAAIMVLIVFLVFTSIGGAVAAMGHNTIMGRLLIVQAFAALSNAIYYPLAGAMWLAMYQDLKLRREGGDLASRAGALSGAA